MGCARRSAAGGGGRRADRAHRGGRAGGRGAVRGSPRDRSAAPSHGRVGPHRAHVRAAEDPSRFRRTGRWGPTSDSCPGSATLGSARRSSASARAATRACAGCWCRPRNYILGPFGPDSDLRRWGERYAGTGAGNAKKRAVIAVARRLAVLLLALWKTGEVSSRCETPWPARPRSGGDDRGRAADPEIRKEDPERERSLARDAEHGRLRQACPSEDVLCWQRPPGSRMCLHAPGPMRGPSRVRIEARHRLH